MREIEFSAVILEVTEECIFISGRCCGDDICLGDVFLKLYKYEHPETEEEESLVLNQRGVSLVIRKIEAYQRSWDRLSSGMTARIKLEGQGAELIEQYDFLGGTAE